MTALQTDPHVMMGKPVVAGTRITVELLLEKLAAGESIEQVVEAHRRLTREAVLAALDFAARLLRSRLSRLPGSGRLASPFRISTLMHLFADEGVEPQVVECF